MKKTAKNIAIMLTCGLVFYILGEPCREFFKISNVTEVRIVAALPLLFSISFGIWGTLGCAIANLIADLGSGYTPIIYIPGFFIQIIYGYLPARLWLYLRKRDGNKYKLDKIYKNVQYMLIVIADSALSAFLIASVTKIVFDEKYFSMLSANIFFNQFITMVVFGFPYLICGSLLHQYKVRKRAKLSKPLVLSFSLNEKFILFFLASSIIVSVAIGVASYPAFSIKYGAVNLHLWSYVYYLIGGMLNLCIWVSLGFLYYMERSVTRPIEQMSEIAKTIGLKSDIDTKIHDILYKCNKYTQYTSEIGKLARSYEEMANELKQYVSDLTFATAEKERTQTELNIATSIQRATLPKSLTSDKFTIYGKMRPALEVGGDFYDFFFIDENHLAMLIADVSGKGVPAALFMMISKIILRHNLKFGLSPAEAFIKTNNELTEGNLQDMFVSCLCGVIDLQTGIMTYTNAGHEKPAIMNKGEDFRLATIKSGFVLGGMEGIKYQNFEIQLHPGDILFTYTDGIPEAINEKNEEFGLKRMINTLNASKDKSLKEICHDMREAVRQHAGEAKQFDDITMVAFQLS